MRVSLNALMVTSRPIPFKSPVVNPMIGFCSAWFMFLKLQANVLVCLVTAVL
jgi:hypothetical protein